MNNQTNIHYYFSDNTKISSKVITWRILVTITNFIGGWIASGNPWVGLGVAGFALVVNSVLYFFHERIWNVLGWGKTIDN